VKKNLNRLIKSDYNLKDKNGNTPLYIAVTYGNLEMAKYLIELGADVNMENQYGK
jgi:ankyrin repeat protein